MIRSSNTFTYYDLLWMDFHLAHCCKWLYPCMNLLMDQLLWLVSCLWIILINISVKSIGQPCSSLAEPDPPLTAEGLDNCKYQTRFGLPQILWVLIAFGLCKWPPTHGHTCSTLCAWPATVASQCYSWTTNWRSYVWLPTSALLDLVLSFHCF